jgi:hypothetical protein
MDFAPMKRLRETLLPFETIEEDFLLIGSAKAMIAKP